MRVGSLFSGIGGLDLGLERAGMRVRWQVEIDPFCRKVLAKHWPDVPCYEDVRDVGAHNLEPVDLVCGGFPCIDISSSGKKRGIRGPDSGLWFEMERVVCDLRPRLVVVENVADIRFRGLHTVLGGLARLGYDAEWETLPAVSFGQPQRRWRMFVVAYANGRGCEVSAECDGTGPFSGGRLDSDGLDTAKQRFSEAAGRLRGMDDGLPGTVDRLRALGNAVVPQVSEWIGRRILEAAQSQH